MTDEGPGQWVPKTAFVMPLLPAELNVDPLLAGLLHCVAFLELSEDEAVDPDWAVEAMEHVAAYLQRLPPAQLKLVEDQLTRIGKYARKQGAPDEFLDFVDDFLENYGAGEDDAE